MLLNSNSAHIYTHFILYRNLWFITNLNRFDYFSIYIYIYIFGLVLKIYHSLVQPSGQGAENADHPSKYPCAHLPKAASFPCSSSYGGAQFLVVFARFLRFLIAVARVSREIRTAARVRRARWDWSCDYESWRAVAPRANRWIRRGASWKVGRKRKSGRKDGEAKIRNHRQKTMVKLICSIQLMSPRSSHVTS